MHQPVDEGARTFIGFLGTIARKPHMCPIKYLDWKAMPKELKEECWCLVKQKYQVPDNPVAYEGLKKFTLQKIGKAWRDRKCRLKAKYYIPHSRNKARVKSNGPKKGVPEDWNILVDHWYSDDAVIESDKNKDRRSKQDDIHTGDLCGYFMHAAKKAKMDGHPVERAVLFQILHTCKNGSAVNPLMKEKMVSNFCIVVGGKQNRNSRNNIIVFPYKVVSKMSFVQIIRVLGLAKYCITNMSFLTKTKHKMKSHVVV